MLPNKIRVFVWKPRKFLQEFSRSISTTTCNTTLTSENRQRTKWVRQRRHESHRILSTINPKSLDIDMPTTTKLEAEEFINAFPQLVNDLNSLEELDEEPDIKQSLSKLLNYTVPTGKKNRGLTVVTSYKLLEHPNKLTDENMRIANVLGWCVEMLHSSFLSRDDLINDNEIRRGVPCWHKANKSGSPISDVSLLHSAVFNLLQRYMGSHPYYVPLTNLYHYTILKTAMGQALDALTLKDGKPNLDFFTMNTYNAIVKYKMAYYSFYLPVGSAMYLAGNADQELHRQAKTILLEMGHFYRVQEDFLDCFGDKTITGHLGNDIKEGRCSWLAVVALQRATPQQKEVLLENYGKNDVECEAKVKQLYEEIGLPNTYTIYEEKSYNIIRHHIQQLSAGLPHDLFLKFMEKLYRRDCELFLY